MSLWLPLLAGGIGLLLAIVVLSPLRHGGRAGFIAACASIGLAAACLYLLVGDPRAASEPPAPSARTLRDGVETLKQALARDPQRADGWALLGRSLQELGEDAEAAVAFERAVRLAPDDAGVLVEAAQARAQVDAGKRFDDTAVDWLQHALAVAPDAERASWLLGIALRQRGEDARAAEVWEALLPRLQPAAAQALREQILIAREATGAAPAAGSAVDATSKPTATAPHGIAINLHLPVGFDRSKWPDSAAVFVLARAVDGLPMPVAVKRFPLDQVPAQLQLSDQDSPMPTQPLSSHAAVEVLVRISRSGSAERGDGDLQGVPVRVTLPAKAPLDLRFER